jgi:hypothetical protein
VNERAVADRDRHVRGSIAGGSEEEQVAGRELFERHFDSRVKLARHRSRQADSELGEHVLDQSTTVE